MVHAREVDGRTLHFGHSGWLWRNAYLLYDRETDSLWHHQTGWAVAGPLRGRALARFPTSLTTFAAWRAAHPGTLVLPKSAGAPAPTDRDVYADRNALLEFGLGVDLPGAFRLYRFADVDAAQGCLLDELAGVPVAVVRDAPGRTALAYDRRRGGDVLRLAAVPGSDPPRVGTPDGVTFDVRTGAADDGGPPLARIFATHWEAGAWRRQHPNGTEYGGAPGTRGVPGGGR